MIEKHGVVRGEGEVPPDEPTKKAADAGTVKTSGDQFADAAAAAFAKKTDAAKARPTDPRK